MESILLKIQSRSFATVLICIHKFTIHHRNVKNYPLQKNMTQTKLKKKPREKLHWKFIGIWNGFSQHLLEKIHQVFINQKVPLK